MIQVFHNPRCNISRRVLAEVRILYPDAEVIEYLKNIPSTQQLKSLLNKLNLKPQQIIRTNEKLFKQNFKGKNFTGDEWLQILHENPVLIERPIVVINNKAVICRPPEKFRECFGKEKI